jgi:hypothetical protein
MDTYLVLGQAVFDASQGALKNLVIVRVDKKNDTNKYQFYYSNGEKILSMRLPEHIMEIFRNLIAEVDNVKKGTVELVVYSLIEGKFNIDFIYNNQLQKKFGVLEEIDLCQEKIREVFGHNNLAD